MKELRQKANQTAAVGCWRHWPASWRDAERDELRRLFAKRQQIGLSNQEHDFIVALLLTGAQRGAHLDDEGRMMIDPDRTPWRVSDEITGWQRLVEYHHGALMKKDKEMIQHSVELAQCLFGSQEAWDELVSHTVSAHGVNDRQDLEKVLNVRLRRATKKAVKALLRFIPGTWEVISIGKVKLGYGMFGACPVVLDCSSSKSRIVWWSTNMEQKIGEKFVIVRGTIKKTPEEDRRTYADFNAPTETNVRIRLDGLISV